MTTWQDQFLARIDVQDDGCWLWTGPLNGHGYAYIRHEGQQVAVHRLAYEHAYGPISEGLVVDHLCRVRACCNPLHLEAVTNLENIMRGNGAGARNARKTHCDKGHPLSGDNVRIENGMRRCVTCARDWQNARRDRERAAKDPAYVAPARCESCGQRIQPPRRRRAS